MSSATAPLHPFPSPSAETAAALELALWLAREVGAMVTRTVSAGLEPATKPNGEATSNADRAASKALVAALRAKYPRDVVVSEEEDGVIGPADGPRVWFVDPIDGTDTLLAGDPGYCVMVGLAVRGRPELGVIHCPTGDATFWAARGGGVWLKLGAERGRRVRCSEIATLSDVRPSAGLPQREEIVALLGRASRDTELWSVGLRLAAIAMGLQDLFVRSPEHSPAMWDTCAGAALLEEAGGRVTDVHGAPLVYDALSRRHTRGLIASNGQLHADATEQLSVLWNEEEEREAEECE